MITMMLGFVGACADAGANGIAVSAAVSAQAAGHGFCRMAASRLRIERFCADMVRFLLMMTGTGHLRAGASRRLRGAVQQRQGGAVRGTRLCSFGTGTDPARGQPGAAASPSISAMMRWNTANTKAVLMPNSSMPSAASSAPISRQSGVSSTSEAPRVVNESSE